MSSTSITLGRRDFRDRPTTFLAFRLTSSTERKQGFPMSPGSTLSDIALQIFEGSNAAAERMSWLVIVRASSHLSSRLSRAPAVFGCLSYDTIPIFHLFSEINAIDIAPIAVNLRGSCQ